MKERVHKLISYAGVCSRRSAEILIAQGRVKINGRKVCLGDKADPENDELIVDGVAINLNVFFKVILLNKPKGYISSCNDPQGRKTVLDLIPRSFHKGFHPVGRLDQYSRGAILLTNHGELTMKLTHPKYSHEKVYKVWVKGITSADTIKRWKEGIILDNKQTYPTDIRVLKITNEKSLLNITLREGRNRQIRRVAEILGHPVIDLQRTSIANICLNDLKEGQWRKIKEEEWLNILKNNYQI